MPFIKHDKFKNYVSNMTLCEVRDYMKSLFLSLASIHELGIIHCDIKPGNCLYNCKERKLKLNSESHDVPNSKPILNHPKGSSLRYSECQHTTAELCSICWS